MPKVSVIVPNFNHARFLRKRIESILAQTCQDFELILLDDFSTDDSRSILSQYATDSRVRLEFNQVNSGTTFKQWNKGVRLAQGEYIWLAESDDYADERLLGSLVAILERDPEVNMAYCRSWRVDSDGNLDGFEDGHWGYLDADRCAHDFRLTSLEDCRNFFLYSTPVQNASSVVFRKGIYDRMGGADESFRICGDWKCWAMLALRGGIAYTSEPLNYYRFHGASVRTKSSQGALDLRESYRVIRSILDQAPLSEAEREIFLGNFAHNWVPVVVSLNVSLATKQALWREVRTIDPHPFLRLPHPGLLAIRRTLSRRWRSMRATFSPAA